MLDPSWDIGVSAWRPCSFPGPEGLSLEPLTPVPTWKDEVHSLRRRGGAAACGVTTTAASPHQLLSFSGPTNKGVLHACCVPSVLLLGSLRTVGKTPASAMNLAQWMASPTLLNVLFPKMDTRA